jgi:hypothetical protein
VPIEVGKTYIAGSRMRWVLAVGNNHVIYSRGGDTHRECQVKTFLRWYREALRDGAELT